MLLRISSSFPISMMQYPKDQILVHEVRESIRSFEYPYIQIGVIDRALAWPDTF